MPGVPALVVRRRRQPPVFAALHPVRLALEAGPVTAGTVRHVELPPNRCLGLLRISRRHEQEVADSGHDGCLAGNQGCPQAGAHGPNGSHVLPPSRLSMIALVSVTATR